MSKRLFRLTDAQANELQAAYLHCRHANTKTRYQAVRLYGVGYPVAQIQDICACSTTSLLEWCRAYRNHGTSALVDQRQGGNRARLTPEQTQALRQQLQTYTPAQLLGPDAKTQGGAFWTLTDLATLLARDYAVNFASPTSYRTLLQRCGLSFQRPAKQYKSHNQDKVMAFEEQLEKKSSTSP